MIQVSVKRPNDGTLVFPVDKMNTVSDLKRMIEERSGVAPELQLLRFGEKQYKDEVTIEDIYYKSNCLQDNEIQVLMLARLRGGVNIVHHQQHYHEDLRKGVAQLWITSGDGVGDSSYHCQSDSDEEDCKDTFYIARPVTANKRLKRWRQAALVLNSSRRFRYTLDLKNQEEKERMRIRNHAQAIRAAMLFKVCFSCSDAKLCSLFA